MRHLARSAFSRIGSPYKIDICFAADQPLRLAFFACIWPMPIAITAFVGLFCFPTGQGRTSRFVVAAKMRLRCPFSCCFWSVVTPRNTFVAQFSTVSGHERRAQEPLTPTIWPDSAFEFAAFDHHPVVPRLWSLRRVEGGPNSFNRWPPMSSKSALIV